VTPVIKPVRDLLRERNLSHGANCTRDMPGLKPRPTRDAYRVQEDPAYGVTVKGLRRSRRRTSPAVR
jgi:hypothetical protein